MTDTDRRDFPLTGKEQLTFQIIEAKRRPPSVRELARELGLTNRAVILRLEKLEKKGYISRDKGKQRTIRVARGVLEWKGEGRYWETEGDSLP